jgi:hypothetical protein
MERTKNTEKNLALLRAIRIEQHYPALLPALESTETEPYEYLDSLSKEFSLEKANLMDIMTSTMLRETETLG